MKLLNNKILLVEVEEESAWNYEDKEALKLGRVVFPFKGKNDDQELDLIENDEVYYQYGSKVKLDNKEYILVSTSNLVCRKQ